MRQRVVPESTPSHTEFNEDDHLGLSLIELATDELRSGRIPVDRTRRSAWELPPHRMEMPLEVAGELTAVLWDPGVGIVIGSRARDLVETAVGHDAWLGIGRAADRLVVERLERPEQLRLGAAASLASYGPPVRRSPRLRGERDLRWDDRLAIDAEGVEHIEDLIAQGRRDRLDHIDLVGELISGRADTLSVPSGDVLAHHVLVRLEGRAVLVDLDGSGLFDEVAHLHQVLAEQGLAENCLVVAEPTRASVWRRVLPGVEVVPPGQPPSLTAVDLCVIDGAERLVRQPDLELLAGMSRLPAHRRLVVSLPPEGGRAALNRLVELARPLTADPVIEVSESLRSSAVGIRGMAGESDSQVRPVAVAPSYEEHRRHLAVLELARRWWSQGADRRAVALAEASLAGPRATESIVKRLRRSGDAGGATLDELATAASRDLDDRCEVLIELLVSMQQVPHRLVVCTAHEAEAERAAERLNEAGMWAVSLHGGRPAADRAAAAMLVGRDDVVVVVVDDQLEVLAESVGPCELDGVVELDRPLDPVRLAERRHCVARIAGRKPPTAALVVLDSIDERLYEMWERCLGVGELPLGLLLATVDEVTEGRALIELVADAALAPNELVADDELVRLGKELAAARSQVVERLRAGRRLVLDAGLTGPAAPATRDERPGADRILALLEAVGATIRFRWLDDADGQPQVVSAVLPGERAPRRLALQPGVEGEPCYPGSARLADLLDLLAARAEVAVTVPAVNSAPSWSRPVADQVESVEVSVLSAEALAPEILWAVEPLDAELDTEFVVTGRRPPDVIVDVESASVPLPAAQVKAVLEDGATALRSEVELAEGASAIARPRSAVLHAAEPFRVRLDLTVDRGRQATIEGRWWPSDDRWEVLDQTGSAIEVLAVCDEDHVVDDRSVAECGVCGGRWCVHDGVDVGVECVVCERPGCDRCVIGHLCRQCDRPERTPWLDRYGRRAWRGGDGTVLLVGSHTVTRLEGPHEHLLAGSGEVLVVDGAEVRRFLFDEPRPVVPTALAVDTVVLESTELLDAEPPEGSELERGPECSRPGLAALVDRLRTESPPREPRRELVRRRDRYRALDLVDGELRWRVGDFESTDLHEPDSLSVDGAEVEIVWGELVAHVSRFGSGWLVEMNGQSTHLVGPFGLSAEADAHLDRAQGISGPALTVSALVSTLDGPAVHVPQRSMVAAGAVERFDDLLPASLALEPEPFAALVNVDGVIDLRSLDPRPRVWSNRVEGADLRFGAARAGGSLGTAVVVTRPPVSSPPEPTGAHLVVLAEERQVSRWSLVDSRGQELAGAMSATATERRRSLLPDDPEISPLPGWIDEVSRALVPDRLGRALALVLDEGPRRRLVWLDSEGIGHVDGTAGGWSLDRSVWMADRAADDPTSDESRDGVSLRAELGSVTARLFVLSGTPVLELGMGDEPPRQLLLDERITPAHLAAVEPVDEIETVFDISRWLPPDQIIPPRIEGASLIARSRQPVAFAPREPVGEPVVVTHELLALLGADAHSLVEAASAVPADLRRALVAHLGQFPGAPLVDIGWRVEERWQAGDGEVLIGYEVAPGRAEARLVPTEGGEAVTTAILDRRGHLTLRHRSCSYCEELVCEACTDGIIACSGCEIELCARCADQHQPGSGLCPACSGLQRRAGRFGLPWWLGGGRQVSGSDRLHEVTLRRRRRGVRRIVRESAADQSRRDDLPADHRAATLLAETLTK